MGSNVLNITATLTELCLPILKGRVLFRSFGGQYNDNPKYISEELHRRYPEIKIIWAIRDGKPSEFPEYAELCEIGSREYLKFAARAEVVVDNYSGCRSNISTSKDPIKKMLFSLVGRKRRSQLNISTWHGTPLKSIAMDEPGYKRAEFCRAYLCADLLMSGNRLTADAYKTALGWQGEVTKYGMPRNDILFLPKNDKVKEKLGLPTDKRVILFAPTYRNSLEMSGIMQLKNLDMDRLLDTLKRKFGGEWVFVFRAHNLVMKEIEGSRELFDERIINGNAHPDMAEYLSVADLLLTDYSSSMFDFMITGRPCFLLTPDLYDYKNNERGFYFDMEKLPFSFSDTQEELLESISRFDGEEYKRASDEFLRFLGDCESGHASENIVEYIHGFMTSSKK